jgi:hypothetical protein
MVPFKMMNLLNIIKSRLNIKLLFFGLSKFILKIGQSGLILLIYWDKDTFSELKQQVNL